MLNKYKLVVDVVSLTKIKDELGLGYVEDYKKIGELKGWLDIISGNDVFLNDKLREDSTHIFICDNNGLNNLNITTKNKIKISNDIFIILLIDNILYNKKNYELILKKES